jgi:tetratricopeptide (TPR) repeat protein
VAWKLQTTHQFLAPSSVAGDRGRMSFIHPLAWEVVREDVPFERRRKYSRDLATWWAERRPGEVETIARLWYEAGDPNRGLPWVVLALREGERAHAPGILDRYARWRLELQQTGGIPVDVQVREGLQVVRALVRLGAQRPASRWGQLLARMAPEGDLRWEARIREMIALTWVDVRQARELLDDLRRDAPREGRPLPERLLGLLDYGEGNLLTVEGRIQDSLPFALRGLEHLRVDVDPWDLAHALYLAGFNLLSQGRAKEGVPLISEGLAIATRGGLRQAEARLRNARGYAAQCEGDLRGACDEFTLAAGLFREGGNLSLASMMMANLGGELSTLERWDEAAASLNEAESLARKVGDRMCLSAARHNQGRLLVMQSRWEEAKVALTESLDLRRQLGFLADLRELLALLAEVDAHLGELAAADDLLGEAEKATEGATVESQVAVVRARGVLLALRGKQPEAREALRDAIRLGERTSAWGEAVRTWGALIDLELRAGDPLAVAGASRARDELRQRIGVAIRAPMTQ